jgi:hypothetical protein
MWSQIESTYLKAACAFKATPSMAPHKVYHCGIKLLREQKNEHQKQNKKTQTRKKRFFGNQKAH